MNSSPELESAGFYSEIRRFSGAYMSREESDLCERVTEAFLQAQGTDYGSNEERNAHIGLSISKHFLGNIPRVSNSYSPFFEVPNSLFVQYVASDLVKGIKERSLVKNSKDAMRYTKEFFSSLEKHAAELVGADIPVYVEDPFNNIAGYHVEKEKVKDALVTQLLEREKLSAMGLETSNGIILYGPPGTGKTSLVKAACESAGINYLYFTGSYFEDKYLGEGAKKIRTAFEEARKNSPAIIVVDEAEVVIKERNVDTNNYTGDLTSTFLAEMEGMNSSELVSVAFLMNEGFNIDKAITSRIRPNYRIEVPLPNEDYRKEILDLKLSKLSHDGVKVDWVVPLSEGWSGRDIHNFLQAAGWNAYKAGREEITKQDLEVVIDEFIIQDSRNTTVLER